MAVVVTGLEVFGDVGKCGQILWILSCTRDVANLMLRYDVLQRERAKDAEEETKRENTEAER